MNDKLAVYRRIDTALAEIRRRREGLAVRDEAGLSRAAPASQIEVLDLPRMCGLHDRPWGARYLWGDDGRWHYAQSIIVTESLYRTQYARNETGVVSAAELGEETCPHCGARDRGGIHCRSCGHQVCTGRSVWEVRLGCLYFRCRNSCGEAGEVILERRDHTGIVPRATGW